MEQTAPSSGVLKKVSSAISARFLTKLTWASFTEANNATIAAYLKDYYLGFVINQDPNSISNSGLQKPHWPQYSPPESSDFTILDFNYTTIGSNSDRDASPRCDFFHGRSYVVRN